jgi:hypothetical protein
MEDMETLQKELQQISHRIYYLKQIIENTVNGNANVIVFGN